MTKQEERNTLKKIADLIASAGDDSYIGRAFAGCVEVAQNNIDNDWFCSMQQQCESYEDQIVTLKESIKKNAPAIDALNKKVIEKDEEIAALKRQLKVEQHKQIPVDLYRALWLEVDGIERQAKEEIAKTAEILALYAAEPQDIAVQNGLQRLAAAHEKRDRAAKLLEQLEKYEPKNI